MKRLVLACALLAVLAGAARAQAETLPCGLPQARPLRVEFASNAVDFRMELFGKPGIVAAASDVAGAAALRSLGAQTVYWHMKLRALVGTPSAPADPSTVVPAGQALLDRAVRVSGCATPVIVLNELSGSYLPTPWPSERVTYRANVLALVRSLTDGGAEPFLLVPGRHAGRRSPFVGGDAAPWWRELGRFAHVVREMHFNAPFAYRKGPIVGARERRIAMRAAVRPLLDLGIPAERVGLLLGFQSGPGKGGREGLEPRQAWFEIVKQDALAARQVAAELGLGSVWSWGWGTFDEAGADPDKPSAACVYLWTNDQTHCDGPRAAGPRFDSSLTLGQIILPPGVDCRTTVGDIATAATDRLASVLPGRREALTALLTRLLHLDEGVAAGVEDVRHAERRLIEGRFGDDGSAYDAYLAEAGLDRATARQVIADQLRRQSFDAIVQIRDLTASPDGVASRRASAVLRTALCLRDELPSVSPFDWGDHLPALEIGDASISIEASRYLVRRGDTIVLRGRVSSERATEVVTVYGRAPRARGFSILATVRVGADGEWSMTTPPRGDTIYRAASRSAASPSIVVRTRGRR